VTIELALDELTRLPGADQNAIATTLINLMAGFTARDADQLRDVYTDDADWVNAFGSVKRGADEIVGYLRGLFADANFNAGTLAGPPVTTIRVLSEDVVLVSTHLVVTGQLLLDGQPITERDNHSLRVLRRQSDGSWKIVSEMYNDANRERSYINHS
jgi:uncharacterized protein (TIGR02246 family)